MIHELKTWPTMFDAVARGDKTHEIRTNDRPFRVNDTLRLNEWDPGLSGHTGDSVAVVVTFITPGGEWGLPDDLCVMSIRLVSP